MESYRHCHRNSHRQERTWLVVAAFFSHTCKDISWLNQSSKHIALVYKTFVFAVKPKWHFYKCDRMTGYVLFRIIHIAYFTVGMYVSWFVLRESLLEKNRFSWIPGRLDVSLSKLVPVQGLEELVLSDMRLWSIHIAKSSQGVLFQELERANQG